jgi:AhpD family alkylhydroperoxidase
MAVKINNSHEKVFLKKVYSPTQGYTALYKGMRTVKYLARNRRKKLISRQFIERIMLAVTEVNGCEVCAYGHTKMALETGMSRKEIEKLLNGNGELIPGEQVHAIMFAQHYADTGGHPSFQSWEKLIESYGEEKSHVILGVIRMIMIGNIYGIPLSAVIRRFRRKKVHKTNIFYELTMLFSVVVLFPFALLQALIANLLKRDLI